MRSVLGIVNCRPGKTNQTRVRKVRNPQHNYGMFGRLLMSNTGFRSPINSLGGLPSVQATAYIHILQDTATIFHSSKLPPFVPAAIYV